MGRLLTLRQADNMPPCLHGFEHVNRYWDQQSNRFSAKILPGEYYVTTRDEMITTVLGSCVSACIRDRLTGVGGMNHFMLPASEDDKWGMVSAATRYGNFAMEHMINDILKNGARRSNLEIKIVGGGKIISSMSDVGKKNIDFVHQYLKMEGLSILSQDVGDIYARKVQYFPKTGKVRVKKLRDTHNNTVVTRETNYMNEINQADVGNDVELF